MSDRMPRQAQGRAHKKNLGAVQTLCKFVEQMQKDRKKIMQNIDQEVMDTHKFLEHVQSSTGNSISYEDVFPTPRGGAKGEVNGGIEKHRPTKSSLIKSEVKLRKSLAEARFKTRSEDFFHKWKKAFELDLNLDEWLVMQNQKENEMESGWFVEHLEAESSS